MLKHITDEFWYVIDNEGYIVAGPFDNYGDANEADWIMDRRPGNFDIEKSDKQYEEGDKLE